MKPLFFVNGFQYPVPDMSRRTIKKETVKGFEFQYPVPDMSRRTRKKVSIIVVIATVSVSGPGYVP